MTLTEHTLTRTADLVAAGLVPPARKRDIDAVTARYAAAITPSLSALIDTADPNDPIARQFVPDKRELVTTPDERADPIGDDAHSPVPGIVHRHRDRVLLKIVSVCPVYCRFCFRRETIGPGADQVLSADALDRAMQYIAADATIWEVILTGGDPFILSPRRVRDVTQALAAIAHVKVIRWHTRVPIVDPDRITPHLIAALAAGDIVTNVVIHANHAAEFTAQARSAIALLADAGIPLLSQSVLLQGVNDDADTLADLMRAFVTARIKPYYLHHPDLAPGTSHFRLPIARGQELMRALKQRVSGPCMPAYVLDIPGGHGKVSLGADHVQFSSDGSPTVTDASGIAHAYPPNQSPGSPS